MSKIYLRNVPTNKRRRVSEFHEHVSLAVSSFEGAELSKIKVRKFSARERDFIAAYQLLQATEHKTHENTTAEAPIHTNLSKNDIEKMRKVYRQHRGVLTCDTGYVDAAAAN
jgi:hypothetical protein